MRKNTITVFEHWKHGKSFNGSNAIWTDGTTIYSYNTPILFNIDSSVSKGYKLILNCTKYSVTTSSKRNDLKDLLSENNIEFEKFCFYESNGSTYPLYGNDVKTAHLRADSNMQRA